MNATFAVIVAICIVIMGGEFLFTYFSDKLGPGRDSSLWKHVAFYAAMLTLVAVVATLLGRRN